MHDAFFVLLDGIGQKMDFVDDIADPYVQAGDGILCIEQYGQGERKIQKKGSGLSGLRHLTERLPRMVNKRAAFPAGIGVRPYFPS